MKRKQAAQGKRELIEPHPGDKRYVRRDSSGRFIENKSATSSLSKGVRLHSHSGSKSQGKGRSRTKR